MDSSQSTLTLIPASYTAIRVPNIHTCASAEMDRHSTTDAACVLCGGREIVIEGKNGILWARPCVCAEQKALDRRINASGLSPEQRKIRLEHFEVTTETFSMYTTVQQYLEDFEVIRAGGTCGKGFCLCGPPGVGKTMLVCAATNLLLERKVPTVFVVTPDLMAELRVAQFAGSGAEMEDKLHRIAAAPVCVFDDLGREKVSEWVQAQYYRIIDKRWRDKLPTIFTSNHSWDDIGHLLGEAVASRLYALTQGRQVFVDAPDRRIWRDGKGVTGNPWRLRSFRNGAHYRR